MIRAEVILPMLKEELQRGGEPEHQRRHEARVKEHALRGRGPADVRAEGVGTAATNGSASTGMAGTTVAPITAIRPGSSSQHLTAWGTRRQTWMELHHLGLYPLHPLVARHTHPVVSILDKVGLT